MAKDKEYIRMIGSSKWKHLRRLVLSRHPTCAECEKQGLVTLACEVHHIRPVESVPGKAERERLMFDINNLMPLCHACHRELHRAMEQGTKEERRRRIEETISESVKRLFG